MKRSSYYRAGLLLLTTCVSNVFGKVTVKNSTTSKISFRMITAGGSCMEDAGSLFSGGVTTRATIANDARCPLVKLTARLEKPAVNAVSWEGNLTGNLTFAVKPNGANGYIVVKE